MIIPSLKTPHLILRPMRNSDAPSLFAILHQPGILRYFPNPEPPASLRLAERFIDWQISHWEKYSLGWWAVTLRGQDTLVGWNGLQFLPETDEVEVGYLLSQKCWGRGLATEGARAALSYGFDLLGLKQIVGIVHPQNIASQRVLEKAGMQCTGPAVYFGIDVYRYAIQAEVTSLAG